MKVAAAADHIPTRDDFSKGVSTKFLESGQRGDILAEKAEPCTAVYLRALVSASNITSVTVFVNFN